MDKLTLIVLLSQHLDGTLLFKVPLVGSLGLTRYRVHATCALEQLDRVMSAIQGKSTVNAERYQLQITHKHYQSAECAYCCGRLKNPPLHFPKDYFA